MMSPDVMREANGRIIHPGEPIGSQPEIKIKSHGIWRETWHSPRNDVKQPRRLIFSPTRHKARDSLISLKLSFIIPSSFTSSQLSFQAES